MPDITESAADESPPFDPIAFHESLQPTLNGILSQLASTPESVEKVVLHRVYADLHAAVMSGYLLLRVRELTGVRS